MFFFDCRPVDRVDVRRDEEIGPFELPRFEVVPVFLEVELRSLANNFWTITVAVFELLGKFESFSPFVVESGFQIELIRLVVSFHLGHEGLHHGHLHVEQICCCWIDAFRDGELRHLLNMCDSVFAVLKAVVVSDVVFGIFDVVEVESDIVSVGCHLDW